MCVFVVVLFDESSCYVLVSVFAVLGFLGLVICGMCFLWFLLFFLEGLRVR